MGERKLFPRSGHAGRLVIPEGSEYTRGTNFRATDINAVKDTRRQRYESSYEQEK